ncbi:MAG: DNA-3-methyladenine glycosylase 2 family protein, partial [Acidobacteriota bacterium]|nr:DNA-3-methyladenine glycosylase 2 family protein [Acidobacteriota bacterium]
MRPPTRHDVARLIVERDALFAPLVERVGPPPARRPVQVAERFPALARTITFQLLATKAASTIHGRVIEACAFEITPSSVLRAGHDRLRAVGLSNAKAAAMIALATATRSGQINLDLHGRMPDGDVADEITAIRGLGPWSAQMYLMNALGRRDVWPVGDYGVRAGWSRLHGLHETIDERTLRAAGDAFAGHRSALAWYCWR